MDTYTRSNLDRAAELQDTYRDEPSVDETAELASLLHDLGDTDEGPHHRLPLDPDPWCDRVPPVLSRDRLMEVVDEFGCSPVGYRSVRGWHQHELLADALQLIAERLAGDPLLLDARDLAAAFGTDLFQRLAADAEDLRLLPDLIAAFVPYAHALRHRSSAETAASLAVIEQCRLGYLAATGRGESDRCRLGGLDGSDRWSRCDPGYEPWRPPPPPDPVEVLARAVGGAEALETLTGDSLPDEAYDLSGVADDVRDRLEQALRFADPVTERLFGIEVRTAVRRLLVDALRAEPGILRRTGRTDTLGAGACQAVAAANHLVRPHTPLTMKELAAEFGLKSQPGARAHTLRQAVMGPESYPSRPGLSPRYLTGERRREILATRDRLRGGQVGSGGWPETAAATEVLARRAS